jgi:hypothetical protein
MADNEAADFSAPEKNASMGLQSFSIVLQYS